MMWTCNKYNENITVLLAAKLLIAAAGIKIYIQIIKGSGRCTNCKYIRILYFMWFKGHTLCEMRMLGQKLRSKMFLYYPNSNGTRKGQYNVRECALHHNSIDSTSWNIFFPIPHVSNRLFTFYMCLYALLRVYSLFGQILLSHFILYIVYIY